MLLASLTASFLLTYGCGQVDPITNSAAWITPRGHMQVSVYFDRGDHIQWVKPVPEYIDYMTTHRKGTRIRVGCGRIT